MMKTVREFAVDINREDFTRYDKEGSPIETPDKTPATIGDLRDALSLLICALIEDLNDIADELPEG